MTVNVDQNRIGIGINQPEYQFEVASKGTRNFVITGDGSPSFMPHIAFFNKSNQDFAQNSLVTQAGQVVSGSKIGDYIIRETSGRFGLAISTYVVTNEIENSKLAYAINTDLRITEAGDGFVFNSAHDLKASTTWYASLNIKPGLTPLENTRVGDLWTINDAVDPNNNGLFYKKRTAEILNLANSPRDIVYINSIDDFPKPIGNYIYLEPKHYVFCNQIITPYTFFIPDNGTCRVSMSTTNDALINIGGGFCFTNDQTKATCANFFANPMVYYGLDYGAGLPSAYSFATTVPQPETFVFHKDVIFKNLTTIGNVKNLSFYSYFQQISNVANGVVVEGAPFCDISQGAVFPGQNITSTIYNIIPSTNTILVNFKNIFATLLPNERLLKIDKTYAICRVLVANNYINNPALFLDSNSMEHSNPLAWFSNNIGTDNSTVTGNSKFINQTIVTDIPNQNIYTVANTNNLAVAYNLERTTITIQGLGIYTGLDTASLKLNALLSIDPIANQNEQLRATFGKVAVASFTVTYDNTTDIVIRASHGLTNGKQIKLKNVGGSLPTGLRGDIYYYVVNSTLNNFQLSYTLGGAAVDFTTNGTGTNYYSNAEFLGIPFSIRTNTGVPFTVAPFGIADFVYGDQFELLVANFSSNTDINIRDFYMQISI